MNKHTSTHEGVTAARNSKHRTYTHVVWVQNTAERQAERLRGSIDYLSTQADEYTGIRYDELVATHGREQVEKWIDGYRQQIAKEENLLAEGATDSEWEVAAWAGSLSLAQTQARKHAGYGYRTTIEPAVIA